MYVWKVLMNIFHALQIVNQVYTINIYYRYSLCFTNTEHQNTWIYTFPRIWATI